MKGVYILHLDEPLGHARHYTGYANDLAKRLAQHGTRNGARMLEVCRERGITWTLGRVYDGASPELERMFKKHTHSRTRCAICNPKLELTMIIPYSFDQPPEAIPF